VVATKTTVTGSRLSQTYLFVLAAGFRPSFANSLSLFLGRGRRESRAPTAPASPCAESSERKHTGLTGTAETSRLSPRNGFTAYTCSPRGSGLSCPRCRRKISCRRSARVAAPGPHDFAVRCERFVQCKHLTSQRPSQPAPTFRDDRANVPHGDAGWARI
jgi:hypothetical protein